MRRRAFLAAILPSMVAGCSSLGGNNNSDANTKGKINDITLSNIPKKEPVGTEIPLRAEIDGSNLGKVVVFFQQAEQANDSFWQVLKNKPCRKSNCSVSATYSQEITGKVRFNFSVYNSNNEKILLELNSDWVEFINSS